MNALNEDKLGCWSIVDVSVVVVIIFIAVDIRDQSFLDD